MSLKEPKSKGSSLNFITLRPVVMSDAILYMARKVDFPVLFSPTKNVNGETETNPVSLKHFTSCSLIENMIRAFEALNCSQRIYAKSLCPKIKTIRKEVVWLLIVVIS